MIARACALLLALAMPATADVAETAEEAIALIDRARARLENAQGAQAELHALSAGIRGYEAALAVTRSALRDLGTAERTAARQYETRKSDFENTLVALQSVARMPPGLQNLHPDGPLAASRAGTILAHLLPALDAQGDALADDLKELATFRALHAVGIERLEHARDDLMLAHGDLLRAISEKRPSARRAETRADDARQLAAAATNLEGLARGLSALPSPGGPELPQTLGDQRGMLPLPVTARLVRRMGEADAAGIARPGIVLAVPPGNLVTAPVAARVRYSGPFLSHRTVVVLEPAPDLIILIAGLGAGLTSAGDTVQPGAPIGLTSGNIASDEDFLIGVSEDGSAFLNESLYIEVRENGIVSDPVAWFDLSGPEK